MMAKTHQAFAVCSFLMFEHHVSEFAVRLDVACLLVMLGALLPDIDSPESSFGRLMPVISKPLHSLLGHRTITHSIVATVLLYSFLAASPMWHLYATTICFGFITHIVGDMLVGTSGVALFWPFKLKVSFNPLGLKVGGVGEYCIFNLLIVVIIVQGLQRFNPAAYQVLENNISFAWR
jgi:inner membrane protein